ncbi:hypothetical protein [Kitasatospora sp. NPDC056531]|uniref:SbtR family transcriptional regulator n=1 Tax=Kitasatospora sp. NPDC056531 TaxID=3345856 RepID=UPI0036CCE521
MGEPGGAGADGDPDSDEAGGVVGLGVFFGLAGDGLSAGWERARLAGEVRQDITVNGLFTLIASAARAREHAPEDADQVLTVLIDGLRPRV